MHQEGILGSFLMKLRRGELTQFMRAEQITLGVRLMESTLTQAGACTCISPRMAVSAAAPTCLVTCARLAVCVM
jgi:hypothetical protein